jgi:hypothetical protein
MHMKLRAALQAQTNQGRAFEHQAQMTLGFISAEVTATRQGQRC